MFAIAAQPNASRTASRIPIPIRLYLQAPRFWLVKVTVVAPIAENGIIVRLNSFLAAV